MSKQTKEQLHREAIDISMAMVDWMHSQDLEPRMACAAMGIVLATIMVDQSKSREDMQRKYEAFGKMLLGMLRRNWREYNDEEEEE